MRLWKYRSWWLQKRKWRKERRYWLHPVLVMCRHSTVTPLLGSWREMTLFVKQIPSRSYRVTVIPNGWRKERGWWGSCVGISSIMN
jgi:hypothetical protein